jgi:hypothetical protein
MNTSCFEPHIVKPNFELHKFNVVEAATSVPPFDLPHKPRFQA